MVTKIHETHVASLGLIKVWARIAVSLSVENIPALALLPDVQNCGLRMRRECLERFHRHRRLSRHASWHVRDSRAVMHARIVNQRFPLNSVAEKTFQVFPAHAQPAILRIW